MIGHRLLLAVLSAVALASPAALAGKPLKVVADAAQVDQLVEALWAEAEKYAQAPGDAGPPESSVTENVQYTPAVAEALAEALKHDARSDPLAQLYVACQLVKPLTMAKDELISKLQPQLIDLLTRARYRKLPEHSRTVLADLNPSDKAPAHLKEINERRRQAALEKKRNAEQAVVKHNRLAREFQQALKQVMILPGDEAADKALLALLTVEIEDQWDTFAHTLEVIKRQAVRMKPDQAKRCYDTIRNLAKKRPDKRHYADPTAPRYNDRGNSAFATKEMWFAQEGLRVANLTATAAREPALIVPGDKDRPPRRRR